MSRRARTRPSEREGQGVVEYGLILALVTLLAIFSLTGPGGKTIDLIQKVGDSLTTVS